jgi:Tol biopolymer transport system component
LSHTLIVLAAFLAASASPTFGQAEVPVGEELFTFATPHFRITYQEPLADSAPLIGRYAEEAYAALSEIFAWSPAGKIDILFVDSLDSHNGWATAIPHNRVLIQAAGSEPGSSIYLPGHYLRRTVFHELTHVFTMDMRFGYNRVLSSIFGKVAPFGDPLSGLLFLFTSSPVALSPSWYLEGQAIWAETEFAPPGRGGSTLVEMIFRAAVLDDNLLSYAKWYLEIPHWPYGLGAYLYGMRLIQHVEATEMAENPTGELNGEIARGFLFANSHAARRATGRSFPVLAEEMLTLEKVYQEKRLARLRSRPTTAAPRLTPKGLAVGQVAVLGDLVYFLAGEEEEVSRLYVYDPARRQVRRTSSAQTTSPSGSLAADQANGTIIYTRLNVENFENTWYEIRRFEPRTGKDRLVSEKGRYRAVDSSPDGRRLVAVSQRQGKPLLLELSLDLEGRVAGERTLLTLPVQTELASPRYAPDGSRIAFVRADAAGFQLRIYEVATGLERTLFASPSQIIAPAWHPGGRSLVFSSDLNGVFNLYEVAAAGGSAPVPLTNVTGGLFFPVFAEDGRRIVATGYDGFGPYLTEISYPAAPAGPLPVISPLREDERDAWLQDLKAKSSAAAGQALSEVVPPRPYNSFAHIRFDYWSPWLTASSEGVQGGVGGSFSDPAGFHDLKILAGLESEYETPLGSLLYTYRGLLPILGLYASADQDFFPDLLHEEGTRRRFDHGEEVGRYGVVLEFPLQSLERSLTVETGYEYKERRFIGEVRDDYRDVTLSLPPSEASEGLVWARLNYFDGHVFGRSSSIEAGRLISLAGEWSGQELGGDLDRSRYLGTWNEYLPVPGLKNHVFKLAAAYGFSEGDRIAQGSFGLGGFASPVAQLTPGIPDTLTLRGYSTNFRIGDEAATAAAAYRFPIWDISRGKEGIFPFYSRQLFAEIFYEGGRTWLDRQSGGDGDWLDAAGAEVNFAMTMLRYLAIAPGIGAVYAPDREEEDELQLYLTVKGWVNF